MSDPLLFTFAMVSSCGLLSLLVYFVITLSDLESDYMNAQQCCSKLNKWVLPKVLASALLPVLLLLHGHWLLTLANLPVAAWLVHEMATVPDGNMGVYDPTEILNRGQLSSHLRDCMILVGYFIVFICIYLYCLVAALVV